MKRLARLLHAPLSNKLMTLSFIYWLCKTQLFYRGMFRRIGRRTVIYQPIMISNADCIEIGDHVTIRHGARLEAIRDPYNRTPRLTIGSNTNIEQQVHIVCHNRVRIGRDVTITGRCAIVDSEHSYEEVDAGKIGATIADVDSFVEIDDGAFIGFGAVILPNVRIGKRSVIGANSVVTRDVPDFSVAVGAPAQVIKSYSHEQRKWIPSERGNRNEALDLS